MTTTEPPLTPDEMSILASYGYGTSLPEGKPGVHTFLHNVATAKDTTKLGNLEKEEVGLPENTIRALGSLKVFAESVMDNKELADIFAKESEVVTATSLSKGAILLRLAVTQKRQLEDITKAPRENKSWFKRKEDQPKEEEM